LIRRYGKSNGELTIFLTVAYFYEHFRNGDPWIKKQRVGTLNGDKGDTEAVPLLFLTMAVKLVTNRS